MVIIPITEPVLSVDEFDNPKIYKNEEAVMVLLTRLILLNPGTIQSHPDMGVGLVKNYRYSVEGSEFELRGAIIENIQKFLPKFQGASVAVELKDKAYYISITIDDTVFMVFYDTKNNTDVVKTQYTRLNEL